MNTKIKLFATCLIALSFASINAQEKETRDIKHFNKINVSSGVDIYLTQGDNIDLNVECDKSEIHKIITEVNNNTLTIYNRRSYSWIPQRAPKVYVTVKDLNEIKCSGGADIYVQNTLKLNSIKITASGGADAYLNITADKVILSSSGGADITIKGTTNTLDASASGGSDINAAGLKAQSVIIEASGGADASVWAEKQITAKASTGSDIKCYGNPEIKNIVESAGGDVRM